MLEDDRDETGSQGFPDAITIVAAGVSVIIGLALGSSGPLTAVSIGPAIVAGPSLGGIVLILAIGTAVLSAVVGFVATLTGRGSNRFGAVFLFGLALAIGIIGGAVLGDAA